MHASLHALEATLKPFGVKASSMFGMPILALARKPICGEAEDGINFKLMPGTDPYAKALSLSGSHLFAPSMKGRTMIMKNWVVIPFVHEHLFPEFAAASLDMVRKELEV
jgi:hypothetical protein